MGVLVLGLCVFLAGGLLSLQAGDGGLMGPVGRSLASACYALLGITAYVGLGALCVVAYRLLARRQPLLALHHGLGLAIGALSVAVFAQLVASGYRVAGYGPGGLLGQHVAELFVSVVSTAGTALVAIVGLVVAVVVATPLRMQQVLGVMGGASKTVGTGALTGAKRVGTDAAKFSAEVLRAVLPERDHDEYLEDEEDEDAVGRRRGRARSGSGSGRSTDHRSRHAQDGDSDRRGRW